MRACVRWEPSVASEFIPFKVLSEPKESIAFHFYKQMDVIHLRGEEAPYV
jgi:hypothetical protein